MITNYYSFLLRIWSSELKDGSLTWRVSIERSDSGEKQIFQNFNDLVEYLEALTSFNTLIKKTEE